MNFRPGMLNASLVGALSVILIGCGYETLDKAREMSAAILSMAVSKSNSVSSTFDSEMA